MRLLKHLAVFSLAGAGLAVCAAVSAQVAANAWLLGTFLAVLAGASVGMGSRTERTATASGAITAAVSIFVGGTLAMLTGTVAPSSLLQAVPFAFVVGAAAGTFAYFAALESPREDVDDRVPHAVGARVSTAFSDDGLWPVRGIG